MEIVIQSETISKMRG